MHLRLILNDLVALIKAHKLLSILLILGVTFSFYTFNMMTGLIQYKIIQSAGYSALHAFSIDFNNSITSSDMENLKKITDSDETLKTALFINVNEDKPMLVGWKGQNDDRWFILDEGRFFSDAEVTNHEPVMVISPRLYDNPDFNYSASPQRIEDIDFTVVGIGILPSNNALFIFEEELYQKYYPAEVTQDIHVHDENEEEQEIQEIDLKYETQIIPYSLYEQMQLRPDVVRLEYSYDNINTYNHIVETLEASFPDATIYAPEIPTAYFSAGMIDKIIQSCLLIIFAMVNITALFVYWLVLYRPVHTTYLLCGATKKTIRSLIAIEWGAITAISFLISSLLQLITGPMLKDLRVSFDFSLMQSLLILVGGYLLTVLFISPQIIKNTRLDLRGYQK